MVKDKWGRKWAMPKTESCSVCGQPDSCGDCDHTKISRREYNKNLERRAK